MVYEAPYPRGLDDDLVAIDRMDLDIPQGAIYGLIGPNGAGKTTLLRIIATLLTPTYGRIRAAGFDCDREREDVCRRIGFMPETFPLYDELMVWEYLEFFAGAYGVPHDKRERTIESVLELTELGVRRDALTGTLSKGMRQRLLLAKTLIHDPELLLLDEPTSGMDPQARIEFRNIIRTLGKMGKTIMISSHILSDLSAFCSAVGIMERGRLLVSGTIEEVRKALEIDAQVMVSFLETSIDPMVVLRKIPNVLEVRKSGKNVVFTYDGTTETKAEILARLIHMGIRVTGFVERENDLEQIFLQVGATKVQ